ncbi:MAG TPA: hypothetical protein P5160_06855 [Candidatus Omnitrophota bacterium]|jgi:uncharacterized BrkB/YihY/UPF0761 family membrane protein|nr:hypothetical protein [Candidatus Omnitrophota bacterium]
MKFEEFMNQIRQWDNRCSRWMMRHFYFLFFQIVLVVTFLFFFLRILETINLIAVVPHDDLHSQILLHNSMTTMIIVFLMILNSFWMLFLFNGMNRIRLVLKDINYNLMRQKHQHKN